MTESPEKFKFAIDRGGTFTDVFAKCPGGKIRVLKLLSEDPQHYKDAPTEGIRRILQEIWDCVYFPNQTSLKEFYASKVPIAHMLCTKHLEHRSLLHDKRRIDDATSDSKITESFIASLPPRPSIKSAPTRWIPHDLNPFIVRPVQNQVEEKQPIEYLTEMRQVTIQFINIIPTTFQDNKLVAMVNKAYQIVCKVVSKVRGVVNKVSLFDKDCMILVLFGLRGIEHEVESQNALKAAFLITKAVKKLPTVKSISVGVTNGWVYCGVVGHPLRREYTVIGGAVNKAARIMCVYEGKVTCDHETYKSCKLSSLYFQLQSALKLKGIADAGLIFEYNEEFDKEVKDDEEVIPLIGRKTELDLAYSVLNQSKSSGILNICFKGDSKVGKTKLLQEVFHLYSKNFKYVVSFVLNEVLQRSFYTVSTIYQQLYDIRTKLYPQSLEDLPRILWDFSGILQIRGRSKTSLVSDKSSLHGVQSLEQNFMKMCGEVKPLVFIDNIQYIDKKSLEILEMVIEQNKLMLICAGCFEESFSWAIMWKLSLNSRFKVINVPPLPQQDVALLMCKFLNVRGISNKLIVLINKTCEGRPGWIQACLLKMINNGELEVKYALTEETDYSFLEDEEARKMVLVAGFSRKYVENSEESSTAVTLDLFDSFSPYQQLIIKTAAVLGEIFTRTTLIVLLKYPNENMLATAIKTLFEEEVFDCASRYVHSGGLQEKKNVCLCYMEEDEYDLRQHSDLPKYAFCKVLHFRSRNIKSLAYELLPLNQKKELHLMITDLLENQNNSCPACLRDNSASIIVTRRFKDLIRLCKTQKNYSSDKFSEQYCQIEEYKQLIREYVHSPPIFSPDAVKVYYTHNNIPKKRVWDPTTCFCLEILTKVYRDLIHHSHCGQHLGKEIFFMLQYSSILLLMNDIEETIPILQEASELCMTHSTKDYVFTGVFKTIILGKIHSVLGTSYLLLGNLAAAKNHVFLSLRQYNMPLISFKYTIPHFIFTRVWLVKISNMFDNFHKTSKSLIKTDFALCLALLSNIYATEGNWSFAKSIMLQSVMNLKNTNPNLEVLCDVYSNALNLYSFCGDIHTCEKLERCFNKELLKYYTNHITRNIFDVSNAIYVLFIVKALRGALVEAIQVGFRAIHLQIQIQAYYTLSDVISVLGVILIYVNRIDDAVYITRLLADVGKKYNSQAYVAYYALCLELILNSNFYLESFHDIHAFASSAINQSVRRTTSEHRLIVNMYCYFLRYSPADAAMWKKYYKRDEDKCDIIGLFNALRFTECLLLEEYYAKEDKACATLIEQERKIKFLNKLRNVQKKWPLLRPRYKHLKAYYLRLDEKTSISMKFLKQANKAAIAQGNLMEECWTMVHSTAWFEGYMQEKRTVDHLDWKLAKTYTRLQLCQILYCLPVL